MQHLKVPGDDMVASKNIDRLVKEVAACWLQHSTRHKSPIFGFLIHGLHISIVDSYIIYEYAVDDLADNNNNKAAAVIKELRIDARMHEHNFVSIKSKKEQTSIIICCICDLIYCEKMW